MEKIPQINYALDTQSALYLAYMPFIKGGGLFIRTLQFYPLGTALNLVLKLMNEHELYGVEGKIVWITPKAAQGNKFPGIGLQFMGMNGANLCNKIEDYLVEMLPSSFQLTDTI
jgi:type IV pilus assembly protein PilZ